MTQAWRLPIPNSWYVVGFTDALQPGQVLRRRIAGQEVVLYRTASGAASVIDAFCPHLGAHFGYGGTVVHDDIRCPFHGFMFNLDGECTATGYGTKPPRKARVRVWRVQEANGVILAWYDSQDCPPTWTPPILEAEGWTRLLHRTFPLKDHPQETVENGVDIGHFGIVHGYSSVEVQREVVIDGPTFQATYAATRPMPVLGRFGVQVRFEFALSIFGLGYSLVNVHIPRFNFDLRLFVFATPTEPGQIDLHLALSMKKAASGAQVHPLLGWLPGGLLSSLTARIIHEALIHDARQDFPIWENKRYLHSPALADGDGPIGKFRIWTRQFYHAQPELERVEQAV